MNFPDWQSWPLGPIPIFLTLWGVYWMLNIYENPNKKWLHYENCNSFALYSIAATVAIGLGYFIRNAINAPIYVIHLNWLPLLTTGIAVFVAEFLERLLFKRLGYRPVVDLIFIKMTKFRQSHSPKQIHAENLKFLFSSVLPIALGLALPDTDNTNTVDHNLYFSGIRMMMGNVHLQAGGAWAVTLIASVFIRGGYTAYKIRKEVSHRESS